ncbi:MAG TPA: hypothetical protein VFU99_11420 [Gaiellaceae bacterium]|nr:hypothetical protein [Gaiellaceae bacterium]
MRLLEFIVGLVFMIASAIWLWFWSFMIALGMGWAGGWLAGDGLTIREWAFMSAMLALGVVVLFLGVSFTFAVGPLVKQRQ